jgi:hypothetical protein
MLQLSLESGLEGECFSKGGWRVSWLLLERVLDEWEDRVQIRGISYVNQGSEILRDAKGFSGAVVT